jgi:2-polyprenyl-3-methyl-5-hydroxy-6-metoxy-1,4-benzoquinol methylase
MTAQIEGCNEQKPDAMARELVRRAMCGRASLGRVLDVGCGIGSLLIASRAKASSLTGVDIRTHFLDRAITALPEADLTLCSVEELPYPQASFDTIFFCDVIEHLENPFVALRRIRHVLAVGGVLLTTTPNSNALLRYVLRDRWPAMKDASHILYFTRFSLRHALTMTGFSPISDQTLGGSGIALANAILEAVRNGGTLVALSTAGPSPYIL